MKVEMKEGREEGRKEGVRRSKEGLWIGKVKGVRYHTKKDVKHGSSS